IEYISPHGSFGPGGHEKTRPSKASGFCLVSAATEMKNAQTGQTDLRAQFSYSHFSHNTFARFRKDVVAYFFVVSILPNARKFGMREMVRRKFAPGARKGGGFFVARNCPIRLRAPKSVSPARRHSL